MITAMASKRAPNWQINCVGHLLPSSLAKLGVQYLNFQWIDAKTTVMFDADGKTLMRIVSFIQSALANHNGILIFSIHGKCTFPDDRPRIRPLMDAVVDGQLDRAAWRPRS